MGKDLFGVNIVPSRAISEDEAFMISGAKITHTENLTTGELEKVSSFIDAVKIKRIESTKEPSKRNQEGSK